MAPPGDGERWGKLPTEVVESGALVGLRRNLLAAYMVIAAHANGRTWQASIGFETIAREGGMSVRTARKWERGPLPSG